MITGPRCRRRGWVTLSSAPQAGLRTIAAGARAGVSRVPALMVRRYHLPRRVAVGIGPSGPVMCLPSVVVLGLAPG
jgi:hypothetical protein